MFRLRDVPSRVLRVSSRRALASSPSRPGFNALSPGHVRDLTDLLGSSAVITNRDCLRSYNTDWMHRYVGQSSLVLCPSTTAQVSSILRYCHRHCLPVVPQGGNTGLVGGSVPVSHEIILSLSRMDRILRVDPVEGIAHVQAGVVLNTLDTHLAKHGFRVPLDLGSKNLCHIGGNVATNAAGTRFIRYGSLRASVLGLEVVLPDGRVLDTLTTMRKDNTGYDLKQLFIGSEGTLGVITEVLISCPVRSAAVHTLLMPVPDFGSVKLLLQMARSVLAETLSAFEFLDQQSVNLAVQHLPAIEDPFPNHSSRCSKHIGLVLIETAGADENHNYQKLTKFLTLAKHRNIVTDATIACDGTHATRMWQLREGLASAVRKASHSDSLKYDISLPLDSFYDCVLQARHRLSHLSGAHVVSWGHVGDGNLHLNVAIDNTQTPRKAIEAIEPWIYEYVKKHDGSISSEHGLGVMKAGMIGFTKKKPAVQLMRDLKNLLDVQGICNPYKVLVEE